MPERTLFPQFRDEGVGSLYPFADTVTLQAAGGGITLDRDMFLDAILYPIGGGPRLGVMRVDVAMRLVTLVFGTAAAPTLCSGSFDPLAPPIQITLTDALGRPAGLLICDPLVLGAAQSWPAGSYSFATGAAELAAACTIPVPTIGVRGVTPGANGALFTGDVWLVGEHGVVISPVDIGDPAGHPGIRVDIVGDVLSLRALCSGSGGFDAPPPVLTINGIAPCDTGDFQINVGNHDAPDTIMRLVPIAPDTFKLEVVGKTIA